jgi:nucleoside-diphosphate-sugar epimerase
MRLGEFMADEQVLVTGGSGFVGSHCVVALLNAGYRVRTTVRSYDRTANVRAMVARSGAEPGDKLTFAVADLNADAGWAEAVDGTKYVLHVASPFPPEEPTHENHVIGPARNGTLRVLRAARDAGVKRVVLTSSFAAISYGHGEVDREFTEDDWTNIDGDGVTAYVKSKVLAERAAWDFINSEGSRTELSVINPTGTFGPTLSEDISTSLIVILTLITVPVAQMPNVCFPVADVRDVADIHVRAMTHPAAAGERFIICCDGGPVTMRQAAYILRDWTGVDDVIEAPVLGDVRRPSNRKAKTVLGFAPRPIDEALLSTAGSLVRTGLVPAP